MKNLVIRGNVETGKHVGIYNIPPGETCTPSSWCLYGDNGKPSCYAFRNNFLLKNVIQSMKDRYQESLKEDFVERMVSEINKLGLKYFRIHSSGDFYSKEYIEKWIEIAKRCPNTIFRSTTRRIDLIKHIKKLNALRNVIIRESIDPTIPKPRTNLRLSTLETVNNNPRRKSIQCINDCEECGYKCWDPEYFDHDCIFKDLKNVRRKRK